MAGLDARPWAGGIAFVSCGVRIGVRVEDAALLDRLMAYLPPLRAPARSAEVEHLFSLCRGGPQTGARLYDGHRFVRRGRGLDVAGQLDLLGSLIESRVATNAPARFFVHAGVVEWRGRAIVLPGHSRSGKTTLVTALLRAGAKYYSDEFAVLDTAGRVHPWARRLRIRRAGSSPESCPPECFGERARQRSLPLGLVVVTAHRPGAGWRPRVLTPGQTVLALMRHTLAMRARPELTMAVLGRAVRGARTLASRRGEADDLAAALLAEAAAARRHICAVQSAGGKQHATIREAQRVVGGAVR